MFNRALFITCLFLLFQGCSQPELIPCVYVPVETKENPYPELTQFSDCASIQNNKVILNPSHLSNIWFEDVLAEIRIHNGVYYVNESGKLVQVHMFDNGADPFKQGFSRVVKNQKYGFINKSLEVVIPYKYDFVFPFENGRSLVCNGCTFKPEGEHKDVVNGLWGFIDTSGKIVVDIKLSKEEALKQ